MHWWIDVLVAAACAAATSAAVRFVHTRTDRRQRRPNWLPPVAAGAGAAAGLCAAAAARHTGSWLWLAPLAAWAVAIAASAVNDAATQRIPTRIVGYGLAVTVPLLAAASALTGAWRPLLLATTAALAAALILAMCWRFLGLGFGDVRLGALGGLGLGHTNPAALAVAVVVLSVATTVQAAITYYRTRDRCATFPLGPALAAAFLTAVAI